MIIDCISDLHGDYPKLECGDLLIVAGDLTQRDRPSEYEYFQNWMNLQKYKKKIVIAGNHDNLLVPTQEICMGHVYCHGADYLCDSGTEFEGFKIWGSPWTSWFHGINPECCAFTLKKRKELSEKWSLIPDDTDILITHSPPYGVFDETERKKRVGCKVLAKEVFGRIKPKLHVFGHIHEGGGNTRELIHSNGSSTVSVNASYMNECYDPINKPIRIIL